MALPARRSLLGRMASPPTVFSFRRRGAEQAGIFGSLEKAQSRPRCGRSQAQRAPAASVVVGWANETGGEEIAKQCTRTFGKQKIETAGKSFAKFSRKQAK